MKNCWRQSSRQQEGPRFPRSPIGHVPRAPDFPTRAIADPGCALGVVVGRFLGPRIARAVITAADGGRQAATFFAVQGSPLDPRDDRAQQLIKQGASWYRGRRRHQRAGRADPWSALGSHFANERAGRQPLRRSQSKRSRAYHKTARQSPGIRSTILIRMGGGAGGRGRHRRWCKLVCLELELAERLERPAAVLVSLI